MTAEAAPATDELVHSCPLCGAEIWEQEHALFDSASSWAIFFGKPVKFSRYEFRTVEALWRHRPNSLSRAALLGLIYFDRFVDDEPYEQIINVYVAKARRKIAAAGIDEFKIVSVWGQGYRLEVER